MNNMVYTNLKQEKKKKDLCVDNDKQYKVSICTIYIRINLLSLKIISKFYFGKGLVELLLKKE